MVQQYRPWAYAPREYVREQDRQRFRAVSSRAVEERAAEQERAPEPKKKGKSPLSRAASFAGKALDKGLQALDVPADYTLRPLMGATTYLGADQVKGPDGQVYRKSPSWGDIAEGFGELFTQSPVESYKEGRQAWKERMADPGLKAGGKVLLGGVSDPLTYVAPGAVKAVTGSAKLGRGGKIAAGLLESPRAASVGGVLGAAGAAQVAEDAGLPRWAQVGATLAGGFAGGTAGARYGSKAGARRVGTDIAAAQGRRGRTPALGASVDWFPEWNAAPGVYQTGLLPDSDEGRALLDSLVEAGIRFGFNDDGTIFLDDVDEVASAVTSAYREAASEGGVITQRAKGSQDWVKGPGKNFGEADDRSFDEIQKRRGHRSNKQSSEEMRYMASTQDPVIHARLDAAERLDEMMKGGIDPKNEALRRAKAADRKLRDASPLDDEAVKRLSGEYEQEIRANTEKAQAKYKEEHPDWKPEDLPQGINSKKSDSIQRQLGRWEADQIVKKMLEEHPDWTLSQVARELVNEQEQFAYGRGNRSYKPNARDKAALRRLKEVGEQLAEQGDGFGRPPKRLFTPEEIAAQKAAQASPASAVPAPDVPHPGVPDFALTPEEREARRLAEAAGSPPPPTATTPAPPELVQRIDEPGDALGGVEKPHGLYTSDAAIESPHADLGGQRRTFRTNPAANILEVPNDGSWRSRGYTVPESSGIAALRVLVGDEEFAKLASTSKGDLIKRLSSEYPEVEWARYFDKQEVLEGYAGVLARKAGYDAIWQPANNAEYLGREAEYVALTDRAFLPESPSRSEVIQGQPGRRPGIGTIGHDPAIAGAPGEPVPLQKIRTHDPTIAGTPEPIAFGREEPPVRGAGNRFPEGAVGEPPRQGEGIPPAPPRGGAPGPEVLPGPEKPPKDMLQTFTRDEVLARGEKAANSWHAKVEDSVKRAFNKLSEESDTIRRKVDPFLREKARIESNINHFVEFRVQYERARLRAAGLEIRRVADDAVGDTWKLFSDGVDVGYADDVIEGTTDAGRAAWNQLSPEKQRALAVVGETNELLNGTKQFHGAEVRIDPDIEGDYFGRKVVSRTYEGEGGTRTINEDLPTGPTRRVGAERTKSRTVQSVEELVSKGFSIDDPWTTRAGVIRGKMLDAEDAYLMSNLGALQVRDPGSTVGLASVPGHPGFAGTWFTPAVARRIKAGLDSNPPPNVVQAVNAVLTPFRASYDASATLQQGMRLWLSNPKAAAEYWWVVAKSLKDPTVYENYVLKLDDRARAMGFEDGLSDLISNDLRYTGGAATNEFAFPSWLTERVKGLGPVGEAVGKGFEMSNNHFDRLLNLYRVEFALNQADRLKLAGLEGDDFLKALRESNRGVNRAFGWTANEPTKLESSLLFAPRYTRASVETLMMALSRNGSIETQMARQHLKLLLAEGAAVVWAVNSMRGYETDFDPRSNNFLRFRNMGGLDITPFGTYNTLFRAIAQSIAGEGREGYLPQPKALWRYAEGKLNPAVSLAYWPIKGETYLGEPLGFGSGAETLQSLGTLSQSNLPFGIQAGINEGPLAAVLGSTGLSNTPVTPAEKRDFAREKVAREMFGKAYDDLSGADKSRVNEDERVARNQRDADRNTLTRKSDRSAFVKASTDTARKLEELGNALNRGEISGNQYRDQYNILQAELRGARGALGIDDSGDKEVAGWFDLYDKATLPDGRIDYEQLEGLQAAYKQKYPDVEDRVLKLVGAKDTPVLREYRAAKKVAAAYYEIPAYKGMTIDESRRASAILREAQDMASFGISRDMKAALNELYKRDPDGVRLARRAQRMGPNPERKRFRAGHPEMARFYSDIMG